MGTQILPIFGARFSLHQCHIVLERHHLAMQAFDGDRLEEPLWLPDLEPLLGGVDPTGDSVAPQALTHIVVLMVDGHMTTRSDRASKRPLVHQHEPAIRIDGLGNRRKRWKRWAGYLRWLVAAGARLVGPFGIVMGQIRLGEFTDLRIRAWSMELQAFLTKGTVKSFHVGIEVRPVRRDEHSAPLPHTTRTALKLKGNHGPKRCQQNEDHCRRSAYRADRADGETGPPPPKAPRHRNRCAPGGVTRSRYQHQRNWPPRPHADACPPGRQARGFHLSNRTELPRPVA